MSTSLKPREVEFDRSTAHARRPAWRRKLVDAERGITRGVRSDSTFFYYFFVGCMITAAGFVLSLSTLQWTAVILAFTMVLSSEMFHQMLKVIWEHLGHHFEEPAAQSLRIGTAAVFISMIGASLVIALVFGERVWAMFGG
jgi:diacylglycerol kinase (ATP)